MKNEKKRLQTPEVIALDKRGYGSITYIHIAKRNLRNFSLLSVNKKGQLKTVRFKIGSRKGSYNKAERLR